MLFRGARLWALPDGTKRGVVADGFETMTNHRDGGEIQPRTSHNLHILRKACLRETVYHFNNKILNKSSKVRMGPEMTDNRPSDDESISDIESRLLDVHRFHPHGEKCWFYCLKIALKMHKKERVSWRTCNTYNTLMGYALRCKRIKETVWDYNPPTHAALKKIASSVIDSDTGGIEGNDFSYPFYLFQKTRGIFPLHLDLRFLRNCCTPEEAPGVLRNVLEHYNTRMFIYVSGTPPTCMPDGLKVLPPVMHWVFCAVDPKSVLNSERVALDEKIKLLKNKKSVELQETIEKEHMNVSFHDETPHDYLNDHSDSSQNDECLSQDSLLSPSTDEDIAEEDTMEGEEDTTEGEEDTTEGEEDTHNDLHGVAHSRNTRISMAEKETEKWTKNNSFTTQDITDLWNSYHSQEALLTSIRAIKTENILEDVLYSCNLQRDLMRVSFYDIVQTVVCGKGCAPNLILFPDEEKTQTTMLDASILSAVQDYTVDGGAFLLDQGLTEHIPADTQVAAVLSDESLKGLV